MKRDLYTFLFYFYFALQFFMMMMMMMMKPVSGQNSKYHRTPQIPAKITNKQKSTLRTSLLKTVARIAGDGHVR